MKFTATKEEIQMKANIQMNEHGSVYVNAHEYSDPSDAIIGWIRQTDSADPESQVGSRPGEWFFIARYGTWKTIRSFIGETFPTMTATLEAVMDAEGIESWVFTRFEAKTIRNH